MDRSSRRFVVSVGACAMMTLCGGRALGQCPPEWLAGPLSPLGDASANSPVDASTLWFDPVLGRTTLVVAGRFATLGGPVFNGIAAWDGAGWRALGGGITASGGGALVIGVASFNGQLVATGLFDRAGGVAVSNIARFDGTSWSPMGSLSGAGFTLHEHNGELYVGGSFASASGNPGTSRVARWNGSAWVQVSGGTNTSVLDMETHNGQLVIGGQFTTAGGVAANRVARLVGGAWQAMGSGMPSGSVNVLRVRPEDNQLYAGGSFTSAGGVATGGFARWNGSSWQANGGNFAGTVNALESYRGRLVIAGFYPGINNSPSIAQWDGAGYSTLGVGGLGPSGSGFTMASFNNMLIVGGGFASAGGVPAQNLAMWTGAAWQPVRGGFSGPVHTLLPAGSGLYVGGDFRFDVDPTTRANNVARIENGTAIGALTPLPTSPNGTNGPVYALGQYSANIVVPPSLYVGGSFTQAGGLNASNLAVYDLGGWGPVGSGANGIVSSIARFGQRLVIAGSFSTVNGVPASNIAQSGGVPWQPLGTGLSGSGNAMAAFNGQLIVGGGFFSAGGVPGTSGVAAWNGTAWSALPGSDISGSVNALAVHNNRLIVAGYFRRPGTPGSQYVAAWDGSTWSRLDAGLTLLPPGQSLLSPSSLAVHNGELYLGLTTVLLADGEGEPGAIDGVDPSMVYRWTGTSWVPVAGGPESSVYALASQGGALWAGGEFTTSGGRYTPRLARYDVKCYANCDCSVGSPLLTPADFSCFLNRFRAGDPYANCDQSTGTPTLTPADLVCFLNKFRAGC